MKDLGRYFRDGKYSYQLNVAIGDRIWGVYQKARRANFPFSEWVRDLIVDRLDDLEKSLDNKLLG